MDVEFQASLLRPATTTTSLLSSPGRDPLSTNLGFVQAAKEIASSGLALALRSEVSTAPSDSSADRLSWQNKSALRGPPLGSRIGLDSAGRRRQIRSLGEGRQTSKKSPIRKARDPMQNHTEPGGQDCIASARHRINPGSPFPDSNLISLIRREFRDLGTAPPDLTRVLGIGLFALFIAALAGFAFSST